MDGLPSLEEELQRELAKQSSDAQEVEERLKASQALLFDLDRKPAAASKASSSASRSAASASPPASRPSPASASSGGGERKPPSISPPAGSRRQEDQAVLSPPSAMAKPPTYGGGRPSPAIRSGAGGPGEPASRLSPATTATDASPALGGGAFGHEDALAISSEAPPLVVEEGSGVQLPGFCGYAALGGLGSLDQQLFAFAGIEPPAEATFRPYFREWFEQEHFPKFSKKLQKELVSRASSKGFFSGLSSQVKKWAMANTDTRLQSEAWCAYFLDYAPPSFRVFGCVRIASVNVGSQALPCWVTFWGLPDSQGDRWVAPPWNCGAGADVGGILDELDERGGMAALAAAAAQ